MNLHEYQAKARLASYGIPVPHGQVADSAEAAVAAAEAVGGTAWAVKAQIHAGGRGKAGGVRVVESGDAVRDAATALLGSQLVTAETGRQGKQVRQVYVEEHFAVARESYLAVLVDRSRGQVALLAAAEGGVEIEDSVRQRPQSIVTLHVDATTGLDKTKALGLAAEMGFEGALAEQATQLMDALYRAFIEHDAGLIEINPLAVTESGELMALDVKMTLDDNALFRHPDLEALRDDDERDPSEREAQRFELNYVKLDGNIGCMVNGAGLALATLDMIREAGGTAADFMDIRPVATREQVAAGFRMLQSNAAIRAILVNIYGGGIMRCDTIAEGIALAARDGSLKVPLVVRAAGTNREICHRVLEGQGIPVTFTDDMADATARVVAPANKEAA